MTEATLMNRLKRFGYGQHHGPMAKACADAAAEIERLREALTEYACPGIASCSVRKLKDGSCVNAPMGQCGHTAHAALMNGWE